MSLLRILAPADQTGFHFSLPDGVRFRPPIGNGHVATNVLSDTVYMNGLFNGREGTSSRARIPAYVSVDVNATSEESVDKAFVLDMYNGELQLNVDLERGRTCIP